MILQIFHAVVGAAFALFIPGFLITLIFFKELTWLQKIALAITFSIMLDVAVGIFLGYNEARAKVTGGLTPYNIWLYELSITGILLIIYIFTLKKKDETAKKTGKK